MPLRRERLSYLSGYIYSHYIKWMALITRLREISWKILTLGLKFPLPATYVTEMKKISTAKHRDIIKHGSRAFLTHEFAKSLNFQVMNQLKAVIGLKDIVFTLRIHVHQTHRMNVLMDVDRLQTNVAAGMMFSPITFIITTLAVLCQIFLISGHNFSYWTGWCSSYQNCLSIWVYFNSSSLWFIYIMELLINSISDHTSFFGIAMSPK